MAGPAPTFDEIWTQAAKLVALWEHLDNVDNAAATNLLDVYDAILQGVTSGTFTPDAVGLAKTDMTRLGGPTTRGSIAERWRPFLREMVSLISGDSPSTSTADAVLLDIVRRHMSDSALSILPRVLTLSVPVVVLSTGNGTIRRMNTDKYGNPMHAVNPEKLTMVVSRDQNTGVREFAEVFRVTGLTPRQIGSNNALGWQGSGIDTALVAAHARTSRLLRNSSFDANNVVNDGDALVAVGDFTNWEVTTPASWQGRSAAAYVYRGYPGAPATQWAAECIASDSIKQVILEGNPGATFTDQFPYFVRVAWKRFGATGNIQLTLGNSASGLLAIGGQADVTWHHLFIPLDEGAWLDVFGGIDLTLTIDIPALAGGTVAFDDVVLVPMVLIGGSFYVADGSDVPWILNDEWEADTVEGSRVGAEFQYWLWRGFASQGWLPTDGAPTQVYP